MFAKMNARPKELWLANLRSGKFGQGTAVMARPDGDDRQQLTRYCCLGVLAETAVSEGVIPPRVFSRKHNAYAYGKDDTVLSLPEEVSVWAGCLSDPTVAIDSELAALVGVYSRYTALSVLNDARVPFDLIANLIEEQL